MLRRTSLPVAMLPACYRYFMFSHNELLCLFCKKKTHTKIKQMTMVRTFVSSLPMPKLYPSCRLPNAKHSLHLNHSSRVLSDKQIAAGRFHMCTALSDILAQTHRFNCAFPLCLVCIDLRFRGRTELTSLKKRPVLWRLTVKSVFIYVIIVTCNLYKHTSGNV